MTVRQSREDPSPQLARALIRSLTRGTAIAAGVRYIHVGHEQWLAAQTELLNELQEDGGSDTKFVRGAYGAGKSHFLSVVQDRAREQNWATSHIECKIDGVQIDRFETLYPKIVSKLTAPDLIHDESGELGADTTDPLRDLLDKWALGLLRKVGIKEDALTKPFDAEERVYAALQSGLMRTNMPAEFARALAAYVRAYLNRDNETLEAVAGWLRGTDTRVRLPSEYGQKPRRGGDSPRGTFVELKPIGTGTARDIMRGILWLVKAAGYSGLVLCIDEIEELAKLGSRRRQDQALQALREHVDNAGGDGGFRHFCMYLAATPEMFEGKDYFPRYDALASRIQPVGDEINWRAPVVDLDRTPLGQAEMLEMAMRIRRVHRVAYESSATDRVSEQDLQRFITGVAASRFRVAKPRLLTRVVIDELERARQQGAEYSLPADVKSKVASAAERIAKEADL